MKHEWRQEAPMAGWPALRCAACRSYIAAAMPIHDVASIIVSDDCPGPPKAKPKLPNKTQLLRQGFSVTGTESCLEMQLNALIDYLHAKEEE